MQSAVFFHPCGSRRKIIKRNTAYHMLHKYVSKCFWHFLYFHYNTHHECAPGVSIRYSMCFDSYTNGYEKVIIAYVKAVISCA
jgi:hypothetical protein